MVILFDFVILCIYGWSSVGNKIIKIFNNSVLIKIKGVFVNLLVDKIVVIK